MQLHIFSTDSKTHPQENNIVVEISNVEHTCSANTVSVVPLNINIKRPKLNKHPILTNKIPIIFIFSPFVDILQTTHYQYYTN